MLVDLGADGRVSVSTLLDGEISPTPAGDPFELVWPLDTDALEALRYCWLGSGPIWRSCSGPRYPARLGLPWELLREPAHQAALRVGEGHNYHNTVFGPTNVASHMVGVELEQGEIGEALRLADDVDISRIPSLARKTRHLQEVAQCYECRKNDTAVFVHLKMIERVCPQEFQHNQVVRGMATTLVKRAEPSYAGEVREFAGRIGLLD